MPDAQRPHSERPSNERIAEYVAGAKNVLEDDLSAGHKLWKSWALDLADNVLALARRLDGTQEQYQTALDRLWEAHDQLCGCDRPANASTCSAPEETWGAFEYLGERDRGSNPAERR